MTAGLVIAGGGLAAQRCCEVLRAAGDERPVTILAAETVLPYDRPPLSKDALAGAPPDPRFRPATWYDAQGVEVRLGRRARGLDPARREVLTDDGRSVAYDDLLIATGARARTLPPLAGFRNVQTLRTAGDAARLRAALDAGGPMAIVGGGLIGLEVAAAAVRAGVDATVIEAAPRALQGVLGPRATAWLVERHRAAGVTVRTGVTVARVRGGTDAGELWLDDGTRVPCAHVLVSIGARPEADWLAGTGLGSPAVAVDAQGRTAVPHIFAAGDVATGGGHWAEAARGAAAVAGALLGTAPREPGPHSFWTDQHGVRLTCIGDTRAADERLVHGDLAAAEFELDHCRDGRVTGVLLAGRPPSALRAARARIAPPENLERIAA